MTDSRWQRFITVLFPALLPPLQLLLFGPHTIYAGNQQEFSAPFWSLAVHLTPMILGVAGVLAFLGVALPARLFRYYVAGLVGIGIVLWVQGNLIVGDYGVLNGQDLDWSGQAWRSRHELALWIGLPVLATIAAQKVFPIAVSVSRVLVALQLVLLAFTAAQADPETRAKWQGPPDEVFELSSKQNVFHFVLDGFQSDVFHDIVDTRRADIDRQFTGFSFFANHLGAFPTTVVSIPAMLTGAVYRNQEPIQAFIRKQFERASLFGIMSAHGYRVDAVSGLGYGMKSATIVYRPQRPYVTYDAHKRFAAWELADLALFRYSPHLLKPIIYNGQSWRLQTIFGETANTTARRHGPVSGEAFLNDFTTRVRVGRDRPLYKYVHVGIPHWPMVLNADCEYIGPKRVTREIYTGQARCGIKRVGEFLARLRDLGLYDSSLIIVSSDHGIALPPRGFTADRDVLGAPLSVVAGSALALLMVKPPQSTGPFRVSEAPTTISDIPATVVDLLGLENPFPGTPAMKLDERAVRPRSFAVYPWNSSGWVADYFSYLDVLSIRGPVLDGNAWKLEDQIYAPGLAPEKRSRGLFPPERDSQGSVFRWSGPTAFLHMPPDARGVALTVRSVTPTPQTVTIEIRGEIVDRVTLSDHEWHALRYPIGPRVKSATAGAEWIVLRVDPPWRVRGDRRTFGVMTRKLVWAK